MTGDSFESESGWPARTFPLRKRAGVVTLDDRGIHHPRAPRSRSFTLTPYTELLHVAASPRAIWLGARRSLYVLPRRIFADEEGPEILLRCVLSRIEALPQGREQLARMAALDAASRVERSCRATWGLTFACLLVFVLQLLVGENVEDAGYLGVAVLRDGDWWRAVTTHFIHAAPGFPLHLVLNLLGLIAFGTLTERPLGTASTLVVMGASAVGATLGAWYAGYVHVVGVSGVVFGLVGAVTWLEVRCCDRLPAWWRVPRSALFFMLGASALLPVLLPFIAGASHLGGLIGGAVAAAALSRGVPAGAARSPTWVRPVSALVVVGSVVALTVGFGQLRDPDRYVAGRLAQLARLPDVSPMELNNQAWLVAVDPDSTPDQLEAALRLAERAADESERGEPTILDTLAELQFLLGHEQEAVETIEEAILQQPTESYYREQRRRFLGERDRDDRPPPPGEQPQLPFEEAPGVTV